MDLLFQAAITFRPVRYERKCNEKEPFYTNGIKPWKMQLRWAFNTWYAPFLFPAERGTLEQYKKIAEELNKAGETCKKAGIQLCYHNHDFEFAAQDGIYPYTVFYWKNTDTDLLKMEIDLYWVTKAKQDPLALFQKYPGRFALWHVKDMDNTPKQFFTEVGNGVIDFKKNICTGRHRRHEVFFCRAGCMPGLSV